MKITYDEATDIIYSELRNCENSIAKKQRVITETYWE